MVGSNSLRDMAVERLAEMKARGVQRRLHETVMGPGQQVIYVQGQTGELISFCSNDYLGLSRHPRVIAAAQRAVTEEGAGAGASRLVTGSYPGLDLLEMSLATLKSNEAALVFGSGYLANIGTIPALVESGDLILIDELAHACQIAGTRLSKARTLVFRHNDMEHLSDLLKTERPKARHCLILSEGVFSMDGDLAPWPEIKALAESHDAWTMIDDAHGTGVIGGGRGMARHWGLPGPDISMGTLSKAFGSYGGFIAAEKQIIQLIVSRAPSFIFATALPPASAAAALEAINVMYDTLGLSDIPLMHARKFCQIAGLPAPSSQIVPLILGSAEKAVAASELLAREGFLVTAIRPPTVPEGTSRLRFTFAADHREADVGRLGATVRDLIMKDLRQ